MATQCVYAQQKKKLTEDQQISFDRHFINANKFLMLKQPDEAVKELKQAMSIDAGNATVHFLLGQIYMQKGLLADAENYTGKATQLDPDNTWYIRQLADIYRQQKVYEKAGDTYAVLYRKNRQVLTSLFDATYMYVMGRQLEKALKLLNEAEKEVGLNEDIIRQKQSIYLAQNKVDKAIKEAEKLVNSDPGNTRYIGMLADIYLSNGREEKANDLYRKILSLEPDNGYALLALADDFRNKKNNDEWYNYTLRAIQSQSLDVKTKLKAIVAFIPTGVFLEKHKEKSFELALTLSQTNGNDPAAWMLLGDMYAQESKYREAHEKYEQAVMLDPSNYTIWRQMIICSNEMRDHALLMKDCEQAIELFPTEGLFYAYYTFGAQQLKRYQDCIDMARRGLEVSMEQKEIQLQLLVAIGDAANFLKQYATSDSAYEAALQLDPDNSYAMNNYAYFLSLRKKNLERAAEMSKRSITIERENASYYDTYGWILFMQGKLDEAKIQVEKSLELAPGNAEVLDHYGDILFFKGDVERAVQQWRKAKGAGVENTVIDKKIRERKWYEQ